MRREGGRSIARWQALRAIEPKERSYVVDPKCAPYNLFRWCSRRSAIPSKSGEVIVHSCDASMLSVDACDA